MLEDVRFYHLQRQPLEAALPRLLEKVLQAGLKAVVRLPDSVAVEEMDKTLWTYDPESFLPHGAPDSGHAARQPIYLTAGEETPNAPDVIVLVNGAPAPADLTPFKRCLYMFDGQNDDIVARARKDWLAFREKAPVVSYWQQKPGGGWEQKA